MKSVSTARVGQVRTHDGSRIRASLAKFKIAWNAGLISWSAASFVAVYTFLLLCIPSQLIVRPIGAPGTPANLWALLGLLWWFLITITGRNPVHGVTALRVTLGILGVAVLLSYANGMATGWYVPADIHQSTDDVYTLVQVQSGELSHKMVSAADRGLLSFAGWAGIMLITAEGLRSWPEIERVITWLVRFGGFVAALGIVQYFSGLDIASFFTIPGLSANSEFGLVQSRSVLNRVSSTAVHPIEFGVVMAGLFFLALHRSLFRVGSKVRWLPTLLIGLALPMSVSRSAILALAISAIIMVAGWPSRWRINALVLAPVAVVALRVVAPGLVGTIRSLFTNLLNDPSISGRTEDYATVFRLYTENPVVGRGLFTFVARYYRILDNQVLLSLLELGALGLAATVLLIGTGFLAARAARQRAKVPVNRDLALSLSAGIAGVVLSYVTFDAWGFPMVAGLTFLLIGLAGAARRVSRIGPVNDPTLWSYRPLPDPPTV